MALNNREIATIIVFFSVLFFAIAISKDKRALLQTFRNLVESILTPYIVIPFILFCCYSTALFYIGYRLTIWDCSLLKDTVIEVLFVGFPFVLSAVDANSEKDLFKRVFLTEIGIAAVLALYLNLESFNLIEEIALQLVILVVSLIQAFTERSKQHKTIHSAANTILATIGIAVFFLTAYQLYGNVGNHDWIFEVKTALLTVLYPLFSLPFLYVLAYWAAIETFFMRMKILGRTIPPLTIGLLLLSFGPRIRYIKHFDAIWASKLSECEKGRDVWKLTKKYKASLKEKMDAERSKAIAIRKGKGLSGFSPEGIWLDRTSLKDIKKELNLIGNHQHAFWMKNGRYRDDISELVETCTPKGCISEYYVSADSDEWACWMINPTGFTLGIGSTMGSYPSRQYEGCSTPNVKEKGLDEFTEDFESCINWRFDDTVDETLV